MRRLLPILLGLVVVIGGGYLILSVFHSRDAAGVDAQVPGEEEPDRGNAIRAGAGVGDFAVPPPTSGPHARKTPTREGRIDDATLLTALALGDVAFVYGDAAPPQALRDLREREAGGPFDPELAAAGQMILLVRRQGVDGVQALAWRHRLQAGSPDDPALGDFAQSWLGRGAPG